MEGLRKALIVANDEYEHDGLRHLLAPAADAAALAGVLGDARIGNFEVQVVTNESAHVIEERIEDLFSDSRREDVLLLHFSCHGLKSESGELFFAARNTRPNRLGSTAVSADFVQRCMRSSRSRSIVLLLDCCYGGAFSKGVTVRAGGDVNVLDSFPGGKMGGGRGRAVITASSAMEYAFEGEQLADEPGRRPSVFTSALVEGLATGEADRDQDGWVSLNELYDFVFDRVREQNPHQTPSRDVEMQGELYVARRSRPVRTPAPLPPQLQEVIDHPLAGIRAGAVQELTRLYEGRHAGMSLAARLALERLAEDDSRTVAATATAGLAAIAARTTPLAAPGEPGTPDGPATERAAAAPGGTGTPHGPGTPGATGAPHGTATPGWSGTPSAADVSGGPGTPGGPGVGGPDAGAAAASTGRAEEPGAPLWRMPSDAVDRWQRTFDQREAWPPPPGAGAAYPSAAGSGHAPPGTGSPGPAAFPPGPHAGAAPGSVPPAQWPPPRRPSAHWGLSALSLLLPVALYFSYEVVRKYRIGDMAGAQRASVKARTCALVGIAVEVILLGAALLSPHQG